MDEVELEAIGRRFRIEGTPGAMIFRPAMRPWLLSIPILLAVVAAYWPGLGGGFVFDDIQNLVVNPTLAPDHWGWEQWIAAMFSSPSSSFQRPLAMLTFALNAYFSGMNPWTMKLTNLGIHLVNTLLVLGLARHLLKAVPAHISGHVESYFPQLVASAWALNPINLMAVLYVIQRMESLSHTFVFAGLLMYVIGRTRQLRGERGWLLVALGVVGGTLLGLLAKESAALLPVYALALEVSVFHFKGKHGAPDKALLAGFLFVLLLPGIYLLYRYLPALLANSNFPGRGFTMAQRLLTEPRVVIEYLHWIVLPNLNELSLYHDDFLPSTGLVSPPATLFGFLGIAGLIVTSIVIRNRRPLACLGLLWFLCAHLLTGTIFPLELVFEHRNYFSSFGVFLVLGDVMLAAPRTKGLRQSLGALFAGLVLFYGISTHLRSREWSSPLRFAISEAEKHPQSPRATYDLARNFVLLSRYRPDSPFISPANDAIAQARAVPGSGVLATQAALIFASRTGQPIDPSLWSELQERLRTQPIASEEKVSLDSLSDCVVEKLCDFPAEQMVATFQAALSQGANPGILSIYGKYAVHVLKDARLALRLWTEARSMEPQNPQFRANLAMLQIQLGMTAEASEEIAALRGMGRLGQHREAANELDEYSKLISRQRAEARGQNEH